VDITSFLLSHPAFPMGCTPLPPGGYFGRKFLVFLDLRSISTCKIFNRNGLRLKYCKIRSCAALWPLYCPSKRESPGLRRGFFPSVLRIADWR
jgi:hypothetical protein